jgi:hypothetical protein
MTGLDRFRRPCKGRPSALATLAVEENSADCWGFEPGSDKVAMAGYATSGEHRPAAVVPAPVQDANTSRFLG